MIEMADFDIDEAGALHFRGRLTLARIGELPRRLQHLAPPPPRIELGAVERMDTVGAWIVHRLALDSHAVISGAKPEQAHLLAQVAAVDRPVDMVREHRNPLLQLLAEIGQALFKTGSTLLGLIGFLGAIVVAIFNIVATPSKFRWHAVVQCFDSVGIKALGIIGLMSFMIGLVIAEQGAAQLRANGLEIFTINLIGRLSVRELGVLMTAIMVAGRSGAAFAAQIGTMKLNEEIDAMRTIGVSPVEALVLPRVLACTIMMPLLGFYAAIISIIGGGLFCWFTLGIPPVTFIARLREVTALTDVWVGLIKAPVFGLIISMTGCFQGMLVENDAEQVGLKTTSAVVQAIFIVIVLDAFFAVFFTQIGWL
jgi:phospholipid/cholesterol/gamma-HCH transport system permease protein